LRKFILIISLLYAFQGVSQLNYDWWNEIHQWDGTTPWHRMQKSTPGYMGPNALPVPELRNGLVDSNLSLQFSNDFYGSEGDFTYNTFAQINIPLKDLVSFHVWWVPMEYFETDTLVRDLRMGRTQEARGWNTGDVYVSTQIQIVKNHALLPDLTLASTLKTASGRGLGDSRFTNAPAYYFDLHAGKNFDVFQNWVIRPHAMAGLYVYQTNRDDQFQNDAFLWGLGFQLYNNHWDIRIQSAGYIGYLLDLDTPTTLRIRISKKWKYWELFSRYQIGNDSFPFNNASLGLIRLF